MANPIQAAVVCSIFPAPRLQAQLLPFVQAREHKRRKPHPRLTFAEHATTRLCSVVTRAISPCSDNGEEILVGEKRSLTNMECKARIRNNLELEGPAGFVPSSYHTAWVAMVPLPGSVLQAPCFPQCVEWILQNQHSNGSWGANEFDLSVNKDILLSTLACVIALKKWSVGPEQINRGLEFIAKNVSIIMDEHIAAPIGFNLTFPSMVSLAIRMGLEFPEKETSIDWILRLRAIELKRLSDDKSDGKEAYLVYVAGGLVSLPDWNAIMKKFQRKNGSVFNSPAATAAALIQKYDDKALQYLASIVNIFDGAVPAVYPLNIYTQLSMVDTLGKIGISRHFSREIKSILDKTYISWSQRDDEIILDTATCAMAFLLLRMNGYDVSSDELSHVAEASTFHNSLEGFIDDTESLLELYKASKVALSEKEPILEKINCWSGSLLRHKLSSKTVQTISVLREVEYALNFPFYATVEPLDHKRNIEQFHSWVSPSLKRKNMSSHVNQDLLALAVEDFSFSQHTYKDELQHLESWEKQNKLDQLQFIRKNLTNTYLCAAASISPHELYDARVACAKSIALTLVVDDLFDVGGSKEELENLISLVQEWDQHHNVGFYSEHVKIVFSAIYTTVNQLGAKASAVQNRDVTKYVVELWLDYLKSLATDAEWQRSKYVPTMEEYMTNAIVTFALGPITLIALYFVGQNLWEDIVKDPEYNELFRLMNTCGRLQNDIQSFERECKDGKLNSVSLLVLHSGGSISIEAAKEAIQESIASCRRDLLRLVLRKDSVIPRECKELFWRLYKTSHVIYSRTDGYSSPKEMMGALNAVINEPLRLEATSPSLPNQLKK